MNQRTIICIHWPPSLQDWTHRVPDSEVLVNCDRLPQYLLTALQAVFTLSLVSHRILSLDSAASLSASSPSPIHGNAQRTVTIASWLLLAQDISSGPTKGTALPHPSATRLRSVTTLDQLRITGCSVAVMCWRTRQ